MAELCITLKFPDLTPDELFVAFDAHDDIKEAVERAVKKTSISDFFEGVAKFEVV